MTHLLLLSLCAVVAGCGPDYTKPAQTTDGSPIVIADGIELREIYVRKCLYLASQTTHGYYVLSHAGDCPNPTHKEPTK